MGTPLTEATTVERVDDGRCVPTSTRGGTSRRLPQGGIVTAIAVKAMEAAFDLTLHLLDECRSEWVPAHDRARWAGDGYASADMALWVWDEESRPRLVAYATRLFLFTFAS